MAASEVEPEIPKDVREGVHHIARDDHADRDSASCWIENSEAEEKSKSQIVEPEVLHDPVIRRVVGAAGLLQGLAWAQFVRDERQGLDERRYEQNPAQHGKP